MDQAKMVNKLNEILRWEWTGLSQYAHYSFVVGGVWREVYSGVFREDAEECFGHANKIASKIVALGGVPTIEREKVRQTDDLREMLENSHQFELEAVRMYGEALTMAEDDAPLRVLLEDIILEEQEGADQLAKLLREQDVAKGKSAKSA